MHNTVKLFSQYTEQEQKEINELLRYSFKTGELMRPNNEFDEYGLYFPIEYLTRIGMQIILFPVENMAHYVDAFTKVNIDNNDYDFISLCHSGVHSELDIINSANATGIGNLAYVYLHCKRKAAREKAFNYLNIILNHFLKQYQPQQ